MALRDITELMNNYRECSRNLWNVYFSQKEDIGCALDKFEQIRELLFDSLVISELHLPRDTDASLRVVPEFRPVILIQRLSGPGEAGYWDQEKDMVVGADNISLVFIDYFDFSQVSIKDFRYFLCKILSFPSHTDYEGREALLEVTSCKVFHNVDADGH
jgi:hypothetical protein